MEITANINTRTADTRTAKTGTAKTSISEPATSDLSGNRARGSKARVIETLREMGVNVEALPRSVISELSQFSEKELDFLVSLNSRLDNSLNADPDVHGYVLF